MACKTDFTSAITSAARAAGIDPSIALSVAKEESGVCQWDASGRVITSITGALGIFQLEPATAAMLGVDPTDPYQNISGGIAYLKQLYGQYGNWSSALAAYNWGPGNVNKALAGVKSIPGEVWQYVSNILGISSTAAAAPSGSGVTIDAATGSVVSAGDLLGGVDASPFSSWLLWGGVSLLVLYLLWE